VEGFFVVVSDDPQGFGRSVGAALAGDARVSRVETVASAAELQQRLATEPPVDLLILDLALAGLGGATGAERLVRWWRSRLAADQSTGQGGPTGRGSRSTTGLRPGRLVVVSTVGDDALVQRAFEWGADYFAVRPFDVPTLVRRLQGLLGDGRRDGQEAVAGRARRARELESRIVHHLESLGVPTHYKGRAYLKDAIAMVVEEQDLLSRVTKELYPRVAALHQTSPFKVERSIRHAIESTVQHGNLERIHELFTDLMDERRTRPTNSAFIGRLAQRIREELSASA